MNVLAIDPGTTQSAYVQLRGRTVMDAGILPNPDILLRLRQLPTAIPYEGAYHDVDLAVEMIASYGMPVGREVFETCVWVGRFVEAWGGGWEYVYRKDVKLTLCQSPRAKDSNIRAALIDLYGPGKGKAVGLKKTPGPLYGFKKDMWAALAVGITYQESKA